jgi:hypothetical protein
MRIGNLTLLMFSTRWKIDHGSINMTGLICPDRFSIHRSEMRSSGF